MPAKPAVNTLIREGETVSIHLSLSKKIDSTMIQGLEGAKVRLYVDSLFVGEMSDMGEGYYESPIRGEQGRSYMFLVQIPDFEDIRCETYLPYSESIQDIEYIHAAGRDRDGNICSAVKVSFSVRPDIRQYFELKINALFSTLDLINISDPVLIAEGLPISVFSNQMIKNSSYTMYVEYISDSYIHNGYIVSPPILVELRTIDEAYYHFLRSLYLYEKGAWGSAIGEVYPPHQVYSNVPNAYGLVGAFSSVVSDTIFPPLEKL